jgi:hypothetical protein
MTAAFFRVINSYFFIPFFRNMIPMNPAKTVPKMEKCFSLPAAPVKYR